MQGEVATRLRARAQSVLLRTRTYFSNQTSFRSEIRCGLSNWVGIVACLSLGMQPPLRSAVSGTLGSDVVWRECWF